MPEHKEDAALLEEIVRGAGVIARKFFSGENAFKMKGDGTPVSEADLAVNAYLKEHLRAARPDYGWLSEENDDDQARLSATKLFVVDPIDGTQAIIDGKPHFTICVAIVEDHQPVVAAVYNPLLDEYYAAEAGSGARLNGQPIHVSTRQELAGCKMLVRSKLTGRPVWNFDPWPAMAEEDRGSAAYRLVLVAAGTFDATISLTSKCDWDLAAAHLIVREAGGRVVNHRGEEPSYNHPSVIILSAIAGNDVLTGAIIARTSKVEPGLAGENL